MIMIGSTAFWTSAPFVQDLLNCMPIKKDEICSSGWHGTAFDFMVYKKGIPMVYEDRFLPQNEKAGKIIPEDAVHCYLKSVSHNERKLQINL